MSGDAAPVVPPALRELYAKRPAVIKPGLARIEAALRHLDEPALLSRPTVLVAGTNGKGTTTGLLWRLLTGLGVRTGLFTSPHLVRFAERIQVSGACIDDDLLLAELAGLRRELPEAVYEPLSFFEVNTLLALRVFRRLGVEVDLLEVGLGGRWDSTNVSRPLVSVITSIGIDHVEFLGPTTSAIAGEKAGVMRRGRPTLWGGDQAGDAAAIQTLRAAAAATGAELREAGPDFGADAGQTWIRRPGGALVRAPWPRAAQGWPGYLRANYQLAFAALIQLWQTPELAPLRARHGGGDDLDSVAARAVAALDAGAVPVPPCMRARFERVSALAPDGTGRQLLLDVCHNVDGARALVQGLRETGLVARAGGRLPGFVSILADKDHDGVLAVLREVLAPIALFASGSERSWRVEGLTAREREQPFYPSFAAAWSAAAPAPGVGPAVVCGSVHAVGEVAAGLGLL